MGSTMQLSEGLESRLKSSSLPLPVRLRLAVNSVVQPVPIPKKERIVLAWLIQIVSAKYGQQGNNSQPPEKKRKQDGEAADELLWSSLLRCLTAVEARQTAAGCGGGGGIPLLEESAVEHMVNVVEQVDLTNTAVAESCNILLQQVFAHFPNTPALHTLIIKLLSTADIDARLCRTVLDILAKTAVVARSTEDTVKLLSCLSTRLDVDTAPVLGPIVWKLLFGSGGGSSSGGHLDEFASFFQQMCNENGPKYQPPAQGPVAVLVDYLQQGGDISLPLAAAKEKGPAWLVANLFCLGLSLHGHGSYFSQGSVTLGKLKVKYSASQAAADSATDPARFYTFSLPLDLNYELLSAGTEGENGKSQPLSKYLAAVTRGLLLNTENGRLTDSSAGIISALQQHHPHLLEPLVNSILVGYLSTPTAPLSVFSSCLAVMLKLRQLPKLVSKLLLAVRVGGGDREVTGGGGALWRPEDLCQLGEAVGQAPRVQSLEIWKCLNYHLVADCLEGEEGEGRRVYWAKLCIPLLSCVLNHGQLSDHNLPSTLVQRIKELSTTSLTAILVPLLAKFPAKTTGADHPLLLDALYEASLSMLDLAQLLVTYRGIEIPDIDALEAGLVKNITSYKQRPLSTSAGKVLLRVVQQTSVNSTEIWQKFGDALLANQAGLSGLPLDSIPSSVVSRVPLAGLVHVSRSQSVVSPDEEHLSHALVLFRLFSQRHDLGGHTYLAPAACDQTVWRQPGNWQNLDSQLGKICQNLLGHWAQDPGWGGQQSPKKSGKKGGARLVSTSDEDLQLLSRLPIEHLDRVLRIAATILVLVALHELPAGSAVPEALNVLLCRCIESTDIFRYVNSGTFFMRLLPMSLPNDSIYRVLPLTVGKFSKTIAEQLVIFSEIESRFDSDSWSLAYCVSLLEQMVKPVLDPAVAATKKETSNDMAGKVCKSLAKYVKRCEELGPVAAAQLYRAAAVILRLTAKSGCEGKNLKLIKKMVVHSTTGEKLSDGSSLLLYHALLVAVETGLDASFLPADWRLTGWRLALDHLSQPEARDIIHRTVTTAAADSAELGRLLTDLDGHDSLSTVDLLLDLKVGEEAERRLVLQRYLDTRATTILTDRLLAGDLHCDFVRRLVSCTPAAVSSSVETLALSTLLTLAPSSMTFAPFLTFVNYRPNISTRHIPLVVAAVRHHLAVLEHGGGADGGDNDELVTIANMLNNLFGLMGRKRDDWGNVAPYLVADVLNTNLAVANSNLRQLLVLASHSLLEICGRHSFEYLSANLPAATNELFKVVLQNYNQHHRFTGKDG